MSGIALSSVATVRTFAAASGDSDNGFGWG